VRNHVVAQTHLLSVVVRKLEHLEVKSLAGIAGRDAGDFVDNLVRGSAAVDVSQRLRLIRYDWRLQWRSRLLSIS
jgi:hypothetical protein